MAEKLPTHDHFIHRRDSIPAVQIHHFAVSKNYQAQGYGSQIMKMLIVFIKVTILPHMGASLLTVNSIKSAVEFYHKQGFDKTGNNRDTANTNMALILSDVT
ncbi:GNAT family N-acetyltransferase [Listeria weihenstephanensis]|uniref:GNAT family N-acetyltransferase n=1 Tax=Listeria weihenstephanensis TaxID=1006155 RepID=A0A841ZA87_9LIST|nr:GNAT family N-acetyltransferase [Listeria weihenstephanensis]MBC1502078.1 GNAT family N-acetyltransferase [Listeria weihenstephanensis]